MNTNFVLGTTRLKGCLLIVLLICTRMDAKKAWSADTWSFTNAAQMRQEFPKHTKNSRDMYLMVVHARNQGLAVPAALVLRDLVHKDLNNPRLQAAYAFSLFMVIDHVRQERIYHPERLRKGEPSGMAAVRRREGDIDYYLPKALKAMPKSSTILLMAARTNFYRNVGTGAESLKEELKAIALVRRALEQDPKWADLHFWLGRMLIDQNRNHSKQVNKASNARAAIVSLQKAEELKPSWHINCLQLYIDAYRDLGQIGKTLESLDAYSKARPDFGKQPWVIKWRQSLVKQLQAKRS